MVCKYRYCVFEKDYQCSLPEIAIGDDGQCILARHIQSEFFNLSPEQADTLITGMREARGRGDCLTVASLAVDGKMLVGLGIHGRAVGETLAVLLEHVLDDPSLNKKEHLLSMAEEVKNGKV